MFDARIVFLVLFVLLGGLVAMAWQSPIGLTPRDIPANGHHTEDAALIASNIRRWHDALDMSPPQSSPSTPETRSPKVRAALTQRRPGVDPVEAVNQKGKKVKESRNKKGTQLGVHINFR